MLVCSSITNMVYQWVRWSDLKNFYQDRRDCHEHNTRNVDDLHVLYGRHDIRRLSLKLIGAKLWNYFSSYIKCSPSLPIFKQNIKNHLLERKMFACIKILSSYVIDLCWPDKRCSYLRYQICNRICVVYRFVLLIYSVCCEGRVTPWTWTKSTEANRPNWVSPWTCFCICCCILFNKNILSFEFEFTNLLFILKQRVCYLIQYGLKIQRQIIQLCFKQDNKVFVRHITHMVRQKTHA